MRNKVMTHDLYKDKFAAQKIVNSLNYLFRKEILSLMLLSEIH